MTDDQSFSTLKRWAPPIIVAAIVGLVPPLVTGMVSSQQTRDNEEQSFLREERVVAYADFVAALPTLADVQLVQQVYNGRYENEELVAAQAKLSEVSAGLESARIAVDILGSVEARDAAYVVAIANQKLLDYGVSFLPNESKDAETSYGEIYIDKECRITDMRDYFVEIAQRDFGNPSSRDVDDRPICDDTVETKAAP